MSAKSNRAPQGAWYKCFAGHLFFVRAEFVFGNRKQSAGWIKIESMKFLKNPVLVLLLTAPLATLYPNVNLELQQKSARLGRASARQAEVPCAKPEYRQFDFWLGDWDAFDVDQPGVPVARTRVTRILDGCVILEDYVGTNGLHGQSFNTYDVPEQEWRQSWVTNHGEFLLLNGKQHGTEMVFIGHDRSGSGKERQVRGTWKPVTGGVCETAVTSLDGGKNWQPWFDIVFRPHR